MRERSRASPSSRILATRPRRRRTTRVHLARGRPIDGSSSIHPSIDANHDRSRDSNRRPCRRPRRDSERVMTRHRDPERVMTRDHGDTRRRRHVSTSPHSSLVRDSIESDRWRRGARRARVRVATTTTTGRRRRRRRRTARVNFSMDVSSCASRREDDDDATRI